jgi:hypothetical protein
VLPLLVQLLLLSLLLLPAAVPLVVADRPHLCRSAAVPLREAVVLALDQPQLPPVPVAAVAAAAVVQPVAALA